jgi:RNA polymerase sigma-70 factor (sigma-E family)
MAAGFEEFIAARGAALLRFALMICGDPAHAEDLVQSALAKAYPRWGRIAGLERPEAYLKRMVVHDHLRWWRRRGGREVPVAAPSDAGISDRTGAHASRDAAWHLLRGLPRRQRAVLVLRYYEDLSDAEIGEVLGCAPSTVRSQASRALTTLRAAIPAMEREALP